MLGMGGLLVLLCIVGRVEGSGCWWVVVGWLVGVFVV